MHKNICYHTRLTGTDQKTTGGTFGGAYDQETIERLAKHNFNVVVKASGSPVFIDKQGREVSVYIYVDPSDTSIGKLALAEWRTARRARQEAADKREQEQQEEVEALMSNLSHDEIVRRLMGRIN
jgi:hypothetical protein